MKLIKSVESIATGKNLTLAAMLLGLSALVSCQNEMPALGDEEAGPVPEAMAEEAGRGMRDLPAAPTVIHINGSGPVVQVMPGPSPFFEEAQPVINSLPQNMQQKLQMVAKKGPFSDKVVEIEGEFEGTFTDKGWSGDKATAMATFTIEDETDWRVKVLKVIPKGNPPFAPHWGGVVTDMLLHGNSFLHNPLEARVLAAMAMWGVAKVWRNGELVKSKAPIHIMLTSDVRDENFNYMCYNCTANEIEEVHLIMVPPPNAQPYQAPGDFLHLMWEQSDWRAEPMDSA